MSIDLQIRAVIVSVEYSDILNLTLPYNSDFITETIVVTTPEDHQTIRVAQEHNALVHLTEVFYRRGAYFNKFAAIEEALDVFGRHGWLLLLDADIAIPQNRHPFIPKEGFVYTPYRRILKNFSDGIPERRKWTQHKRPPMKLEQSGYFQLFHGSDRSLGKPPWHSLDWTWAGSADAAFQNRWPAMDRVRPPFEVLHLGLVSENWAGRVTPFIDGTIPKDAALRRDNRSMLLRSRKIAGALDIFDAEKLKQDASGRSK